jgi:deoxyribodipyrimidine photo-lyase
MATYFVAILKLIFLQLYITKIVIKFMKPTVNIIWFRRDLRLIDNAALYYALKDTAAVLPIFIFDKNILDKLEDKTDKRVVFIANALQQMQDMLVEMGSSLQVFYGTPVDVFKTLGETYIINKVFANADYDGYSTHRDLEVGNLLASSQASLQLYKDHVIFEKNEVVKDDGKPYTIFTPYSRKWKAALTNFYVKEYSTSQYFSNFYKQPQQPIVSLQSMGFSSDNGFVFPDKIANKNIIEQYSIDRNFPGKRGTTQLGVHLRFGTISTRALAASALQLNETFLNEIIWRDFYSAILYHFPRVNEGKSFKKEYDLIAWRNNENEFNSWCKGQTGYPIVDAGMRELNATGFMHNRVRMIVASFLTKHLLIDWRWGEAYFAQKLLDFDFAANNGGWQWAAGCGCDAAPYFRVFNPTLQTQKFDAKFEYIKKWVPEFQEFHYAKPIVEHSVARQRCLDAYGKVLKPSVNM